jgi:enterochelin esterase-like enzyme
MTETSPRIARLVRDLPARGQAAVDELWQEVRAVGTPLVEAIDGGSALVTFLWRGAAAHTATGWGVDLELRRIAGTDLWYGSRRLPTNLRTLYYLRHTGDGIPGDPSGVGVSHVDALNRHPFCFPPDPGDPNDHASWASLLELPDAPAEPWSRPRPGVRRGTVLQAGVRTAAWGGRRRVGVYRPAGAGHTPSALLVVFDGHLSRTVLAVPTTLDNLIAAGRVPPTLALFVSASSGARRFRELRPAATTRHFVTRELLPWARRRWPITDDPRRRVVAGSSLGGLAAAYLGLVASDAFGGVIAQSGSFWWPAAAGKDPQWLIRAYAERPQLPLRFYLDVGDRETIGSYGEGLDQLTVNRRLRDVLRERGYQVTYAEYVGAHDYVNWRRTVADGLLALLGDPRDLAGSVPA